MPQPKTDPGQRVADPAAVTGEEPAMGAPDPSRLKEGMTDALKGSDDKLKARENAAEQDGSAVRPQHRENNAGQ